MSTKSNFTNFSDCLCFLTVPLYTSSTKFTESTKVKLFFALILYRFLLLLLLPVILIFFLIRSKNNPAYRQGLHQRLGWSPKKFRSGGILIHAASVGEVIALKTFIEQLLSHYSTLPITVTTFTPTGAEQVRKLFGDRVQHCYLPLDITVCNRIFLQRLQPSAMVFMETELWPSLIAQAKQRQIKLLLINGRLSQKSMRHYQKLIWLIKPCLHAFDYILSQSQDNHSNFLTLGAPAEKTTISGNLKFDIAINDNIEAKHQELASFLPENSNVWLVASTHPGDEALILSAFKYIKQNHPKLLLILVPRHPERFNQVANLCTEQGFSVIKRSDKKNIAPTTDIWLLDTLGELMPAYALAQIVTIGGSFSNIGGHNPLEPALFKKPIIVGPDMSNFTEIFQQLQKDKAVIQLAERKNSQALAQAVEQLLQDPAQQMSLGEKAYAVVMQNQGASQRTLATLQQLLEAQTSWQQAQTYCLYNPKLVADFTPEMFSAKYWQAKHAITGSAQGRGTTWFIKSQQQEWVLRHYYRGGLIGKINQDSYVFNSQQNTRAAQEYQLLQLMKTWQLPCPTPVAYRIIRHGLFYKADLLTSRITHAQDLVALLTKQAISTDIWYHIGATLKRFHDKGIYHHDLNSHNILLDKQQQAWLIDFDRGEHREIQASWQEANMQRLLRSFRKEQKKLAVFHWREQDWQLLLAGYNQS